MSKPAIRREPFDDPEYPLARVYHAPPVAGELVVVREPPDLTDDRSGALPRLKAMLAIEWLSAQGSVKTIRIRDGASDDEIKAAVKEFL